ncbi:WD40 repeat-like protein [Gloeophyllum trabeum ATCC 11539]|uniref:WD40 repeat-like protein n=1 Tax=Gloeophyllum trabeum (strain ATCC 11539 / FP-39264 / Madison 617) TaxID=670483 RepID=S7Q3Z3_GLOTA|nr:WD40 repeat-like protein [Gloeophyllum trabeum ATCC 11539]EPQ54183.1 WD40 repeat-like protein [Gloeophyllum trabeum ATCC 11539]
MAFYNASNLSSTAQRDVELADPPSDSISSLSFSPTGDYLAVGSWDNQVRVYEVAANLQSQGRAVYSHQGPVLDLCWSKDGARILSGGADNAARVFDIQTGQSSQVAAHDAPVKAVRWVETPQGSILITGSWDKTIKYWDLRSPQPVGTVTLPERCYSLDASYPLMAVGTADRSVQIFDLRNPMSPQKCIPSPLKWQTRVVSCFHTGDGFAIGSVEGRTAIQFVDPKNAGNNYTFRCHRKDVKQVSRTESIIYAVNDIRFHPVYQGTFATCGSDGTVNFWERDSRTRLKTFEPSPGPVTSLGFNRTGTLFAYAVSYDWSQGHSHMKPGYPNKIMLHTCKDEEVRRKPAYPGRR